QIRCRSAIWRMAPGGGDDMIKTLKIVLTQKTHEGTTERLLQLVFGYFGLYVIVGVLAKYFAVRHGIEGTLYTVYNTMGGMIIPLLVVFIWGWYKFKSNYSVTLFGLKFPKEFLYIIPSGVCTAVIIPTTTLLYVLPISVMVAMIIMRASVIIISRLVDEVQIRQGILHKKVYWEENVAVLFAILAIGLKFYYVRPGDFDFIHNAAAMTILSSYLISYCIRLYIMNYYKNTLPKGAIYDTKGFFAIEQISACIAVFVGGFIYYHSISPDIIVHTTVSFAFQFKDAFINVPDIWLLILLSGVPFGLVSFFSVFLFMFKGRTATFAGLTNRLTSLIAGTTATLITWLWLKQKAPKPEDWLGLIFIFIAIYFMSMAEKKRVVELVQGHEIEEEKESEMVCPVEEPLQK
ncbi:MAG: hypothetical protein AB1633_13460, partial [Elusimicrobiota bacterium]